jgi:hypothetical protein
MGCNHPRETKSTKIQFYFWSLLDPKIQKYFFHLLFFARKKNNINEKQSYNPQP